MKRLLIIFFTLYLGSNLLYTQTSNTHKFNLYVPAKKNISLKLPSYQLIILQTVIQNPAIQEEDSVNDYVTFILLWITTLLTVITPLILIYLWIYYSSIYVKKYRRLFSVKKWLFGKSDLKKSELTDKIRLSYRKVYSLMIGFGISILAYSIASIRFMVLNYNQMETALAEYFGFPILVLDEFGLINSSRELELKFDEFWNQMLLIVVLSALFFLIGYLLGALIVDLRFKYLKSKGDTSPKKITMTKEMFRLDVKRETEAGSEAKTIHFL